MVKNQIKINDETLKFYQMYIDEIDNEINADWDSDYLAKMLYNNEFNWNNGDITSGMYNYSEESISSMLEDIFNYLCQEEGRCEVCGRVFQEDRYITDTQNHPYGEGYASETISIGHECVCGHEMRF